MEFKCNNGYVEVIYVKFDHEKTGLRMNQDSVTTLFQNLNRKK